MDAKTYLNSLNKSVNDKSQDIHGELYVGKSKQIARTLIPTAVAALIIGISGYIADKYNKIDNINATIEREINDDDSFVLDQMRMEKIVESYDLSSKDLYEKYKEAINIIKNKEDDSNIVNFDGRDIEIDQEIVKDLVDQTADNLFYLNDDTAQAVVLVSTDVYLDAQHDLEVEKNNASVRR